MSNRGLKNKLPIVPTQEQSREFIKARARKLYNSPAYTKLDFIEMDYFLDMLDALELKLAPEISDEMIPYKTKPFRYTPRQMFDNIMAYFRKSLESGQPLTRMGIGLFNDLRSSDMSDMITGDKPVKELAFLNDCFDFVEMYVEYTAQKKTNPAFQIFWLKNRGWKDKLEIEASSTQGALTEEERREMQKKIKTFSE